MQVVRKEETTTIATPAVSKKIVSYIFGFLIIFCGLYSPFELTRVLLLIRDGYNVVVPWYLYYEIAAIWLGSVMVLGLIFWGFRNRSKDKE